METEIPRLQACGLGNFRSAGLTAWLWSLVFVVKDIGSIQNTTYWWAIPSHYIENSPSRIPNKGLYYMHIC